MVALTLAHHVFSCRARPKVNVQTGCLAIRSLVALVAAMEKTSTPGRLYESNESLSPSSILYLYRLAKSLQLFCRNKMVA